MEPSAAVVEKGTQFLAGRICDKFNEPARRRNLPDIISRESIVECIMKAAEGKGDYRYVKLQAMPYVLRILENPSGDDLIAFYEMIHHFEQRPLETGFLDDEKRIYFVLTNEYKTWVPENDYN